MDEQIFVFVNIIKRALRLLPITQDIQSVKS